MNANDRQEKRCRWDWDARDDRYVTGHSLARLLRLSALWCRHEDWGAEDLEEDAELLRSNRLLRS
jgi:hypothetical protein